MEKKQTGTELENQILAVVHFCSKFTILEKNILYRIFSSQKSVQPPSRTIMKYMPFFVHYLMVIFINTFWSQKLSIFCRMYDFNFFGKSQKFGLETWK